MVVAAARHGLGEHDARRVGGLKDAAEVAPAGDLLDEHLVRVGVGVRVRVRLGARVSDLLDEHRREPLRAQLLVHAEEVDLDGTHVAWLGRG